MMEEKQKKFAIYTCITGRYDTPTDNFRIDPDYDYILLSDEYIKTNCWKCLIPVFRNAEHLDNTKKQRYMKTHPHEIFGGKYDAVIWIDANTTIDEKLYNYIRCNIDHAITFKNHPMRHCIYDELSAVEKFGKDTKEMCRRLRLRYIHENYPCKNGLYETNIIISHPQDKTVQTIFNEWWKEIEQNSKRDQLSLNYILWKNKLQDFPHSTNTSDFLPKQHKRLTL